MLRTFAEAKRLRPHKTCALMLDLKGRVIRTSKAKEAEGVRVKFGDKVLLRCDNMKIESTEQCIQIDCFTALGLLKEGDEVKFGDSAQVFGEVVEGD